MTIYIYIYIYTHTHTYVYSSFPGGPVGKESACMAGDTSSTSGWGGSPGDGNGNPFQYSSLEHAMNRGAWWALVHGVIKSWT